MVPNQNPEKIVAAYKKFVKENTPAGIETEVRVLSAGPGDHGESGSSRDRRGGAGFSRYSGPRDRVHSQRRLHSHRGDFATHLGIPTILMGFGLPDDGLHSPNEKYKVANYYAGIMTDCPFL